MPRSSGSPKSGSAEPGKPPTNPFVPTTPSVEPLHLAGRALALEEPDARACEHLLERVRLLRMVVVVAEHGEDRHLEPSAGRSDHLRLLRLAARRQVAGEQDDVRLSLELRERTLDALAARVGSVDVGCGGNADHGPHVARSDKPETTPRCPSPPSRS